jgi:hypothetical protein
MFNILIIFFDFFSILKICIYLNIWPKKSAQSSTLLQYNLNIGTHGPAIWFQDFPCTSVGIFIQLSLPNLTISPHLGFPPKLFICKLQWYVSCAGPVYSQFHFHSHERLLMNCFMSRTRQFPVLPWMGPETGGSSP